jgi:two-component system LytT family sensor kinase
MKRSFILLLHFGFWFCYLLLIVMVVATVFRNNGNDPRIGHFVLSLLLFAILPSSLSFYTYYFFLFRYISIHRLFVSITIGLLISLSSALIASSIIYLIGGAAWDVGKEASYPGQIAAILFVSGVCGVIALVIKGFISWVDEIKIKEALRQKTHEMEMALIKSQLDPHFLFNTINNIDVLILKDAFLASDYLNKLSDIMRFILYETKSDKILLAREIEYIRKYLELQKIRTSNDSYASFIVKGVPGSQAIAPMIFIPFIENAFKHTLNKKLENAISISIDIQKDVIIFACKNKYTSAPIAGESNGLGNDLIQKRLNLIYPKTHNLIITKENGQYDVSLVIPHE